MKKKATKLLLTGGLGNQLFQISAALAIIPENKIECDWILGRPRLNALGLPEVSSFTLPERIFIAECKKFSTLASKALGFQLRKGVSPKSIERVPGFNIAVKIVSTLFTLPYFRELRWPAICSGVGYSEIKVFENFSVLVGYFQSYKWLDSSRVRTTMRSLKLENSTAEVEFYRHLAEIEKPLIIHIRLTDYVGHESFGIPGESYFLNAIDEIQKLGITKKLWLFSDEPENAMKFLHRVDPALMRIVPEIDGSASATLEVMRFGVAYVTSNSTFSWWAAFISHSTDPYVITPSPWFKFQEEPIDLISPNWHRRESFFP
jgi:hypothetical protein